MFFKTLISVCSISSNLVFTFWLLQYSAISISELISLKSILGFTPWVNKFNPRVIIGVPSGITQVEKRAVIESAESAGAREVYLIEEP